MAPIEFVALISLLLLIFLMAFVLPAQSRKIKKLKQQLESPFATPTHSSKESSTKPWQSVQTDIPTSAQKKAGTDFELRVMDKLRTDFSHWLVGDGRAKLLHDVNIPGAQIDLVLIDTSGIYIIECKNWQGFIAGKSEWKYWFAVYCDSVNEHPGIDKANLPLSCYSRKSPTEQNRGHQRALYHYLKDRLSREFNQFRAISVFPDYTNLSLVKIKKPTNKYSIDNYMRVCYLRNVSNEINRFDVGMDATIRLSLEDVNLIYSVLTSAK